MMLLICGVLALLACLVVAHAPAGASTQSRLQAAQASEHAVQVAAAADSRRIARLHAPIADLQAREQALQGALDVQQGILDRQQSRLRADRARLVALRSGLAHDQAVLASQLRSMYETAPPDIVTVVIESHGFAELLERVDQLKLIGRHNAQVTQRVHEARDAVAGQTRRLAIDEQRQRAVTAAAASERNQVDELRVALVTRQERYIRARDAKSSQLAGLRERRQALQREAEASAAAAARAQGLAFGGPFAGGGGGGGGFFQSAGTNYSVGDEPEIAARLDRLGKALNLHLIGISGYRTPQHSVEVGGFANDPHTRGQASDTPGVEGVPEATLESFGLTRPFGGAQEANHIQLAG
jgi:peptidoglycan hydrolase CwlO-like protein